MDANPAPNSFVLSLFLEFHLVHEETLFIHWSNSQSVLITSQYKLRKSILGLEKLKI